MHHLIGLVLLLCLLTTCDPPSNFPTRVNNLKVEYATTPQGIDAPNPRLGWQITSDQPGVYQQAYRIQVAGELKSLQNNRPDPGDRWDSGWVKSNNSVHVTYAGEPLKSRDRCYWRVQIRDQAGRVSPWSEPGVWTMGLLDASDWNAEWISHQYAPVSDRRTSFRSEAQDFDDSDSLATYFRHEVDLTDQIVRATATITGLGYYELSLNGERVGDAVLDPAFTDYQRTVGYRTYDVTSHLRLQRTGPALSREARHKLTIDVTLGGGFYNLPTQDLFQINRANWKTPNKLLFNLLIEYANGSTQEVVSNENWRWRYGPIVHNSLRGGETIDLSRAPEDWKPVVVVPAPIGKLRAQYIPPMRRNEELPALRMWSPAPDTFLYDFGENLTGWVRMEVSGKPGRQTAFDFNEALLPDSTLNTRYSATHTWGRFQHGVLISGGAEREVYEPRFTYHGFRYLQVTGLGYTPKLDDVVAVRVYNDLADAGTFECSNERLNELHAAVRRTLENSIHSMPGEEPTREKMGWTLDGGMETMESYMLNYDAINAYRKYLQDLIDAQEPDGHIPPIVPTNGWGFNEGDEPFEWDDPWWGGTIYYVTQKLYQYTGDTAIVAHAYPAMRRYLDYLYGTAEDDIVSWSLGDWLDLTHWKDGINRPGLTPVPITSTAGAAHFSRQMAGFARLLGKETEARELTTNFERIRDRFNEEFLAEDGWYAPNSQTAQAVALWYDLAPEGRREQVMGRLLEAIRDNDYHTSVGFLGVKPLLYQLSETGHLSLAYRMVNQEESPGWLHYVDSDRSTMGENLNAAGYGTGHHPQTTNVGFWLYAYLGGIQPFTGAAGLDTIDLKPGFNTPLEFARATHRTPKGTVRSDWRKEGDNITYRITIPANMTGRLVLARPLDAKNWVLRAVDLGPYVRAAGEDIYLIGPGAHTLRFGLDTE